MWKSIGSVRSGEDRSVRSNRSRQEVLPESFRQSLARRSNFSPEPNRSFCFDFLEHRKEKRNHTSNSLIKSQAKSENSPREDMFTSMRNVLKDDRGSKLESNKAKNPEDGRNAVAGKQTFARIKGMKKQHGKLKSTIQNEFTTIKNYFNQLEDFMHSQQSHPEKTQSISKISDPGQYREILAEAMAVDRFFQQMDGKKRAIMQKMSLSD